MNTKQTAATEPERTESLMRATGIVRRVDDLGRIVIPKEIRRTMHIREGDPLEIYTETGGEIVFRKYSPVGELGSFAEEYASSLFRISRCPSVICDRDSVIAFSGTVKKETENRALSDEMLALITGRAFYAAGADEIYLTQGGGRRVVCSAPIIANGEAIGAVVLLMPEEGIKLGEAETKLVLAAADFLSKCTDY